MREDEEVYVNWAEGPGTRGSVVRDSAVDVDRLAGDEAAVVTDEEQAGGGDFLDRPLTSEGNARGVRHLSLVPRGIGSRGVDRPRRDDVDADVLRGELGSEAPRQPHEPHLRRGDVGPPGATDEGSFARQEHDAAIPVRDHALDDRPGAIHGPVQDDAANRLPVLTRQLRERLVGTDGRVVDEDVDLAEL